MIRIQLILSLDLLLRLLSYNPLLPSDCLHCLKTPTNLSNSITLSNIFYESISVIVRCNRYNKSIFQIRRQQLLLLLSIYFKSFTYNKIRVIKNTQYYL